MPIVVRYDDPALVATLAGNAGQFATDQVRRDRAAAEVDQAMGINQQLTDQAMRQWLAQSQNAQQASMIRPQQQLPGGPGMTPGGATINYPTGTMPPPGEQVAYGQNLAQKAQAGVFDQQRQQHIAQQQPILNQIEQAARAGQIDPQTAQMLASQIEAGGDGYKLLQDLQQRSQQQQGLQSAKAALGALVQGGRISPEEAVRYQAMIDAGENPFLKGGRSSGTGGEDRAFAQQQKEQRTQKEKLHKFRMESIDADIKALEAELGDRELGDDGGALREQIKALREKQQQARQQYESFLTEPTDPTPQAGGAGTGAATGAAQSARLPVAVVPSQIKSLAPGTKFIGPDGREWVRR